MATVSGMGAEMATVTGDCLATVSARAAGHGSMREDEWVEMAIGSSLRGSRDCGNRDAHCWLSRPWTSCRRGDDAAPRNLLASRLGKTPGRIPQNLLSTFGEAVPRQ